MSVLTPWTVACVTKVAVDACGAVLTGVANTEVGEVTRRASVAGGACVTVGARKAASARAQTGVRSALPAVLTLNAAQRINFMYVASIQGTSHTLAKIESRKKT